MKLTEAASEMEAATICGFLAEHGIRATYDKGGVWPSAWSGASEAFVGRQEILVRREDAERAAGLLAELR